MNSMQTCNSVTFYFIKNSFSWNKTWRNYKFGWNSSSSICVLATSIACLSYVLGIRRCVNDWRLFKEPLWKLRCYKRKIEQKKSLRKMEEPRTKLCTLYMSWIPWNLSFLCILFHDSKRCWDSWKWDATVCSNETMVQKKQTNLSISGSLRVGWRFSHGYYSLQTL